VVKVTLLKLNGYNDWNIWFNTQIELVEFTPEALTSFITEGESSDPFDLSETGAVVKGNAISIMGEESGFVAVLT